MLARSRQVNATYFDDVRVPVSRLVGEENLGWKVITAQLNSERFIAGPVGKLQAHYDRFLDWARKTTFDRSRLMTELPEVRRALAEIDAMIAAAA